MHGLVALDRHQAWDLDAADRADGAEVVAQEVDDHQVLGPVLLVVAQARRQPRVLVGAGAARARPLDRLRLGPTLAVDAEEALGRGAEHGEVAEAQEGGERGRVDAAQLYIESEGIGADLGGDRVGQAELVAVAGAQVVFALGDVGEVVVVGSGQVEGRWRVRPQG